MSRKAHEILLAIKTFFDEGADCVYANALLFGDDRTLKQHMDDVLNDSLSPVREIEVTKRRKIAKNYYGNWVGFEGKKKVRDFGKQEEAALQWLWGV